MRLIVQGTAVVDDSVASAQKGGKGQTALKVSVACGIPSCSDKIVNVAVAISCPHNCSGHGWCVSGICYCEAQYSGKDCSIGDYSELISFTTLCCISPNMDILAIDGLCDTAESMGHSLLWLPVSYCSCSMSPSLLRTWKVS